MTTVIERWASIQSNNYFSSDLNLGIRTEKESLTAVFNQSLTHLSTEQNSNPESIIQAAVNINARYLKALEAQNIFSKVYLYVAGYFGFSLEGSYNQLLDRLATVAANCYGENIDNLSQRFIQTNVPFEEEFLKKVIAYAQKNIENGPHNRGYIYQITNIHGITSYLIGTIHHPNNVIAENSQMKGIVERSRLLVTELADDLLSKLDLLYYRFFKLGKGQKILDYELISTALGHNIRTEGLETSLDRAAIGGRWSKAVNDRIRASANPDLALREQVKKVAVSVLKSIRGWKKGDEEIFRENFESAEERCARLSDRNLKWMYGPLALFGVRNQGLVEKLRTTLEPICIAVGSAHCFGEDGLIQGFRSNGLLVTRVPA